MPTAPEQVRQMTRGLLTKNEKEFLRGEKPDVQQDQYRYNIRSNVRARIDQLEDDLKLLEESGEDDLVNEFHQKFGLEYRVKELERQLEEERSNSNSDSD